MSHEHCIREIPPRLRETRIFNGNVGTRNHDGTNESRVGISHLPRMLHGKALKFRARERHRATGARATGMVQHGQIG